MRRFFPGTTLASRLEVLPDLGLVYVRNPKVATSTVIAWLDWLHSGEQRADPRRDGTLPKVGELGWERVMSMVDGAAFRFSFVRDPVSRFESAYRSKMLEDSDGRRAVLAALGRDQRDPRDPSFEEFLGFVESQEPLTMDLHWRPQHLNLMHPVMTYDLLGRLESFESDVRTIARRMGLAHLPAQKRNVTHGTRASEYDGRPDLVERVRAVYAADLELYGY